MLSNNFLFGISLTGSFLAGALALFAPCCITFLLPSYLGTIFKRTEKVLFYTLVFSLGLSTVLVPVALGFKYLVSFFDQYHSFFYYLGALMLVVIGIMTLLEIRLPFSFRFTPKPNDKVDAASIYGLGVISGLTSSCCAPVLFAAITLTSLAPSLLQAVLVAFAYVFGIVFPLFLLSFFYDKIAKAALTRARQNFYRIFKVLAATIFILSGLAIAVLNFQGKIVMMTANSAFDTTMRMLVYNVSKYFQNPALDIAVFLAIVYLFFKLLRHQGQTATDPVCGMKVEINKAKYKKTSNGQTYYFCSEHCLKTFKHD